MKKDKKKDTKETKVKEAKMNRIQSVAIVLKSNPNISINDLVEQSDKLYAENGGSSNIKESKWASKIVKQVFVCIHE